jgi:hypothetical protein
VTETNELFQSTIDQWISGGSRSDVDEGYVGTIGPGSRVDSSPDAPTIGDDSDEQSEIGPIENGAIDHMRGMPQEHLDVAQKLRRKIAETTAARNSEPNPVKQASMNTQIALCNEALGALNRSDLPQFKRTIAQLNVVEKGEAKEEENGISAELLRKQEEAERKNQEELKNLENELKELINQLKDASSLEECDAILNKMLEVQGKINAIRPPQIRPTNRQPDQQPQSLGQQAGGAAYRHGSQAASGGGPATGVGRGGGSSAGGEANSARLVKSGNQHIHNALDPLAKIKQELNYDKEKIEIAIKAYSELLSGACLDRHAFDRLRQQALGVLDFLDRNNDDRLKSLNELRSSSGKPGQSVDPQLFDSVNACEQDCTKFAETLKSVKREVNKGPAEVIYKALSRRPDNIAMNSMQAIRVH